MGLYRLAKQAADAGIEPKDLKMLPAVMDMYEEQARKDSEEAYKKYMNSSAAKTHSSATAGSMLLGLAIIGGSLGMMAGKSFDGKLGLSLAGAGVGGLAGYGLGKGLAYLDNKWEAERRANRAALKPRSILVHEFGTA